MEPVVVCRKCKGARKLAAALVADGAAVEKVKCQSICKGPVVSVVVDGRREWFSRVEGRKARRALVRAAERGRLGERLEARRVLRRSGRTPKR